MIKKYLSVLVFSLLVVFGSVSYVFADAYSQAQDVAADPSNYDGGSGSTLNTASTDYPTDVPDVGPSGPVGYYDENGDYHSN